MRMLKNFVADESGAVTVDWVVLTAAIVGLGIAVISSIAVGTGSVGSAVGGSLEGGEVATLRFDLIQ
jgi:Flp pilus assembly pilin Flp